MLLFMGPTLLKIFRMQNSETYSARNIFGKIGSIVGCVTTGFVSVIKDYPNNNPFGSTADPFWWENSSIDNWLTVYDL